MPDIIQTSALKVQIQSPDIISKAYEIHNMLVNLMPQIPQEGQRCLPFVALDISCAINLHPEVPRNHFAKAAVVPQSVYQRYLEVFIDALESQNISSISFEYILRCLLLFKYESVAQKFLQHITPPHGFNARGIEKRSNFAIAAYLTSLCLNRTVDVEILCAIAGCSGNKSFGAQLKSAKAKSIDLLKELRKEVTEQPLMQVQNQEVKSLEILALPYHMYAGSGEGVMSFCGINNLKIIHP